MHDTEFYELKVVDGEEVVVLTMLSSFDHFARSKEYGYPECCALDYICDLQHDRVCDRPSCENGPNSSYIVCRRCKERGKVQ